MRDERVVRSQSSKDRGEIRNEELEMACIKLEVFSGVLKFIYC